MRVIFMGTPDFSVPTLTEIVSSGHEVVAVYTRAPKPAGRGQEERKSPVHVAAEGFGIPVFTPRSLKGADEQGVFALHDADLAVVVAYGLLLPKPILDAPRLGCINLHGSLLPRWRGAAPIQRAVMAGDSQTGVMVMQMDEGLDTGAVGLGEVIPIGPDMTAGELHDTMMRVGADLMGRALAAIDRGSMDFTPQSEDGANYAKKIEKAEARIDWSRPAEEVHNHIRGLSPFPGAWFEIELGGKPVRVKALRSTLGAGNGVPGTILGDLTITCGTGAVRLTQVQREGKGAMDAATFLRGAGTLPPTVL
ncbi:methionyl-tRNA formyltransferase [Devosia epidermidihirudinis]|uniref:Methionyl-tRNA formyltransferase n=1 Tax=Devosia epidermidihirudinis TaxID=1293439 RepID=A0A0F5QDY1_9HYPH|nr:methionyl-tRNA formyltransferase [Devosia epidermidihirudinis]KKC38214.1 methionyl-tRNA formyltransferase [Devosia epidermidihirudinis]